MKDYCWQVAQLGDGGTMQPLTLPLQNQLRSLSARKKNTGKKGINQHCAIACGRERRNWGWLMRGTAATLQPGEYSLALTAVCFHKQKN